MRIIEYSDKYLEDVKDLLVELEEYILSIDDDNLDQLHPEYRDKMAILDLEEVRVVGIIEAFDYKYGEKVYTIGDYSKEICDGPCACGSGKKYKQCCGK